MQEDNLRLLLGSGPLTLYWMPRVREIVWSNLIPSSLPGWLARAMCDEESSTLPASNQLVD